MSYIEKMNQNRKTTATANNDKDLVFEYEISETKGQIVNLFEDFIDEKEYCIPSNDDKGQAIDDARASGDYAEDVTDDEIAKSEGFTWIYGEDYDLIGDPAEKAIREGDINGNVIQEIYDGFNAIMKRSGIMVSSEDEAMLKNKVIDTFKNWGFLDDIANVRKEENADLFDAAFIEKPGIEGLSTEEIVKLLERLRDEDNGVYPLEISGTDSMAMGFITAKAADKLDFQYNDKSLFANEIKCIMSDVDMENPDKIYKINELDVLITRV